MKKVNFCGSYPTYLFFDDNDDDESIDVTILLRVRSLRWRLETGAEVGPHTGSDTVTGRAHTMGMFIL
jgi:hypothetical protein